jgi:hypothetical protein
MSDESDWLDGFTNKRPRDQMEQAFRERVRVRTDELLGLRHILSAIVAQAGGEFVLDDRARMLARPDDDLSFVVDTWNRCLRIRRQGARPVVQTPVVSGDRLPDWML